MEYTGLLRSYSINRPLSKSDHTYQIHQKTRLDISLSYELSVIKFNSNHMEVIDKFFKWKGGITTICTLLLLGIFTLLLITAHGAIFTCPDEPEAWALLLFGMAITSPLIWLLFKSIRKEINYTHYPIRLDRNNNKIHVFRQNGSTLSADWNAIFFTLSKVTGNHWEIQGHILKPDNITIIETFSFCSLEVGEEGRKACYHYWEFLRRYMEEGPQSVVNEIKAILPIPPQKHDFTWMVNGFIFTFGNNGLGLLTTLVYIIITIPGRWLAMRYSKIPHWPKEIEEQSPIQPNDPYFRDATSNPK